MFVSVDLIQAVESHPCIWDPHDDMYASRQAKVEAWGQVLSSIYEGYDELSESEQANKRDEAKRRWNNIKDFYRKHCIKRLQGRTSNKYIHSKYLKYMDKVMDLSSIQEKLRASGSGEVNNDENGDDHDDSLTVKSEAKERVKAYTMKDNEKLIDLIEKHPSFWDKTSYSKTKKDRDLDFIASQMEPEYESFSETEKCTYRLAVLSRWFNIRDAYRKNMKALASGRPVRPYIYFKHLKFLDAIYDFERITDDDDENHDDEDEGEGDGYYGGDYNDNQEVNTTGEPSDWSSKFFVDVNDLEPKRKKTKAKAIKRKSEDLNSLVSMHDDEDLSFFKSILPDVKELSKNAKMDFKIKVLKVLKGLQSKDDALTSLKIEEDSDNSDL